MLSKINLNISCSKRSFLRVFTCTPIAFDGSERFFNRDSGLFCRALSLLGVESQAIMPEPSFKDDQKDLIRVPYRYLECKSFWSSLKLDGLILYSWASPRYQKIAEAVKTAGVPLLVNVDSSGLVSRLANPRLWHRDLLPCLWCKINSPLQALRFAHHIVDNLSLKRVIRGRVNTYDHATVVCGVSPLATRWLINEAHSLRRTQVISKIYYLPNPQLSVFSYDNTPKENIIMSVARWEREDWIHKNPKVLLDAISSFLETNTDWRACIIGQGAKRLIERLGKNRFRHLERVEFIDFLPTERLVPFFRKAKICVWSSPSEGQIGTGAQALCCGCSVVAGNSGTLSCFHHYVTRESGRLALGMDAYALCEALHLEASAWSNQHRDPMRISRIWSEEFHERNVAARALKLLGLS
jgi:glycosyltransferase involved in cell wall biosynthesis